MSTLDRELAVWQRRTILTLVLAAPVVFSATANDPFGVPKFALLLAGMSVLLGTWVTRLFVTARVTLRVSPATVAISAFAIAVAIAWATAPVKWLAAAGAYGRWTGAVAYLAYVLVAFTIADVFDLSAVARCVRAVALTVVPVATYGVLQLLGADPWNWQVRFGDAAMSTLGNPNFAGAYLGVSAPLLAWVVLTDRSLGVRLAAGGAGLLGAVAIGATETLQGPLTAGIGLGGLLVAWLLIQESATKRRLGLATLGLAALAAALAVPLMGGLAAVAAEGNLEFRTFYWKAGVRMFLDAPLLGQGMDHFFAYYRAFKPVEAAEALAVTETSDAAHSVPLMMFSSGGLLLGLAYLAVIATTFLLIVAAWRRAESQAHRLLVGAIGGAWLAYQSQSLISIDVTPLALVHWVLIGLLLVLSGAPLHSIGLPWNSAAKKGHGGDRRRGLAAAAGLLISLPALWAALLLLRADLAAGPAVRSASTSVALERLDHATDLVPWEVTYWNAKGKVLADAGQLSGALEAFEEGASRSPRNMESIVSAARVAAGLDDYEAARQWYLRAVEVAPNDPEIREEAAKVAGVD